MPEQTSAVSDESTEQIRELDVRDVPKPQRHRMIFDVFITLPVGGFFVLVNSHDPKHLHEEFEREYPGTYSWDYVESGPVWQIRIGRLRDADLPQILYSTRETSTAEALDDVAGAVWKLDIGQRHLDANVIYLPPAAEIGTHIGPDLDVLLHVVSGEGELTTESGCLTLTVGAVVWLPRRSRRSITAGATGLRYLSVHPKRPALSIGLTPVR